MLFSKKGCCPGFQGFRIPLSITADLPWVQAKACGKIKTLFLAGITNIFHQFSAQTDQLLSKKLRNMAKFFGIA